MVEINESKYIFNLLQGKTMVVSPEWCRKNDEFVLELIVAKQKYKAPIKVNKEEINNLIEKTEKIKYNFKENKVKYNIIIEGKEKEIFSEKYKELHWEDMIIYLIELNLIGEKY